MGGQLPLPPQGARYTDPLPGVTQGLALWARIFTFLYFSLAGKEK